MRSRWGPGGPVPGSKNIKRCIEWWLVASGTLVPEAVSTASSKRVTYVTWESSYCDEVAGNCCCSWWVRQCWFDWRPLTCMASGVNAVSVSLATLDSRIATGTIRTSENGRNTEGQLFASLLYHRSWNAPFTLSDGQRLPFIGATTVLYSELIVVLSPLPVA